MHQRWLNHWPFRVLRKKRGRDSRKPYGIWEKRFKKNEMLISGLRSTTRVFRFVDDVEFRMVATDSITLFMCGRDREWGIQI